MKLAMEAFDNRAGEVREHAVRLVATCRQQVGEKRIEGYLEKLRDAQREVFNAEFEKMDSGEIPPASARSVLPTPKVPPARGSAVSIPVSARTQIPEVDAVRPLSTGHRDIAAAGSPSGGV